MRRRSRLAVTFVALLTVSWSVVATEPRGSALAADPEAELAKTQARLAEAQAAQSRLQNTLDTQRAELRQLEQRSTELSGALDIARAELEAVTAEHDHVTGLLGRVREQVEEIKAYLVELRAAIGELEAELGTVSAEIRGRTADLEAREALLQEHMRDAYEQSQTSLLEVLLSADSLDTATKQVGYLLAVSDQHLALAEEIRAIREELDLRRETLRQGRRALAEARAVARVEEAELEARKAELADLEARLAELKLAADAKRAEQERALNAALQAQGNLEQAIADNQAAAAAAADLAARLQSQAAAQQAAIEEAKREAQRRAAEEAKRRAAAQQPPPPAASSYGFRWPEASFRVTQEWGPTSFVLEPPYTYKGTYYPHFHGGIDIANGCGTPILAVGPGVVVASGQPLYPWDSGYGVVVDHGSGIQSWYWHISRQVVVRPGQIVVGGDVIGYEDTTGLSTGCHLHFAINHHGVWENPRWYLP